MKTILPAILLLVLMGTPACKTAPQTADEIRQTQIDRIGSQLRCPVCRGVPISDSPSTLAQEMMTEVRKQATEGKTDEEILKYFQARYGEWILLNPKPEGMNLLVWVLPALFLIGGGVLIVRRIQK